MKKVLVPALAAALAIGTVGLFESAEARHLPVIGGGSETGVYYQVAVDICKLVTEKLRGHPCKGQPALGSVANIKAMSQGYLDFAVIQSDHKWESYRGERNWKGNQYPGLLSVFSLYPETVMLVTRAESGIKSVADLRGKRVNIGSRGSGHRANAEDILRIYGIDWRDDVSVRELASHDAARDLGRRRIDALFYTVGKPWDGGIALAEDVNIRMIPIDAPDITKFVGDHPYYIMTAIPGGMYKGVDKAVPTYAVRATFVTSDKEPEEVVYNVVKIVFENLDRFRTMHPAFVSIQPQEMLKGLSAPLHPGAIRYYKEEGWM